MNETLLKSAPKKKELWFIFLFDYVNEFFNYVYFKYMQKVTN